MAPAEPQRQPSIRQTARDGATQIGEVHGNVYIGGAAPEAEISLDLDAYREHQLSQLAIWERQYTRLDVDPAVALAGQDLRPVPDSRLALTEAFLHHKRLVVVGGAGAGKTTSMLYLVASVLPGGSLAASLADFIPLYIELGRFRGDPSTSPLDSLLLLIAETLFRGKACPEPPSLPGVLKLLNSHRFLFLLDGLNEAQAGLRASCQTAIDDLAKLHPDHRIVLSSRPHGFSPPQGWEVVLLRELDEVQIPEFVERYTQDEASLSLLQAVLEADNPLLRLPLFLSLVVRMSGSPLPDLQRRLRSRSGLISQYVEFLLQRDLSKGSSSSADVLSLEQLRDTLDRLAQAFQVAGQVLQLDDARKVVEVGTPGRAEEARQILADLCERGVLATDGQNLRFWHQTIQEYFYAGSITRRWRGSEKKVGRMPQWLRQLAAKDEEEEALSFVVAHLRDEEAEDALRHGLYINPALAISWADDLSLENRAVLSTERFPARVRRFTMAARRYTQLGTSQAYILSTLGLLSLEAGIMLAILFAWLGGLFLTNVFGHTIVNTEVATGLFSLCGILLASLPFLDALFLCPSEKKLESALGAIPEIRDSPLHKAIAALAREISHSRLTRRDIRALAQGVSGMGAVNGEELVRWLRTSDSPYATTLLIGHLDTPAALPILAEFLKLNNFLSLAALEALAIRGNRLRDERRRVTELLWAVWKNPAMSSKVRRLARKHLLHAGEHPGGQFFAIRIFTFTALKTVTIFAALATEIVLINFASSLKNPMAFPLILWVGISSVLIWRDARKIGARRIWGLPKFENWAPWEWAYVVFLYPFLIPLYFLNRARIRRDATPVDWDALLQMLQAEGPHGDSRSITESPSPSGGR